MADSDDTSTEYEKIPSHILVQKQLHDLIEIQKARVAHLEQNVSYQNESIRDNFVSRDQYETEVSSLQESLRSDYVPRDQYDMTVKQLEEEKVEHAQTRAKLNEVVDKLEETMEEVKKLQGQLLQQKSHHEKASGSLKSKTMQETAKTMKLQSKCSEISRQCEQQEEVLSAKNREIQGLERRLKDQEVMYRKEMTEAEIERKQQRYIAKMMEEEERKKSRNVGTHQAIPKTKQKKR